MTTCLGKSCSFGLPRVPFVNCCQFIFLVISLWVLRAGCGIWLYQFLIIAYLFTLLRAINGCFSKGRLSESLKRGIITCSPKGNKDKLYLKNWRPISLLKTSYKLTSACIAERLKQNLPYIINEDQTGFISGRFIGENIRLLYAVIDFTEKKERKFTRLVLSPYTYIGIGTG